MENLIFCTSISKKALVTIYMLLLQKSSFKLFITSKSLRKFQIEATLPTNASAGQAKPFTHEQFH